MKELSLNILDISENSVKACATVVEIILTESGESLQITVKDNGKGMTEETLNTVMNPFYTTRTTRKVGMGIPLFKDAAEMTGGRVEITSRHIDLHPDNHGTEITAYFFKNHIDFTPLGDVISSLTTLVQGHPNIDFVFLHCFGDNTVSLDTRELRAVLEDIPLDTYEVLIWIRESLAEQYKEFYKL